MYLLSASSSHTCHFLSILLLSDVTRFFMLGPVRFGSCSLELHSLGSAASPAKGEENRRQYWPVLWGILQSQWHKPGQNLKGHTGFGHAKLSPYFQRRRNSVLPYKLEAQNCSRVFPDGSRVHTNIRWVFQVQGKLVRLVPSRHRGLRPLGFCFQFLGKCHQPCRNGGKCTGKNKCKCSKGYQGDLCSKREYQSHSISPYGNIELAVQYLPYIMSALIICCQIVQVILFSEHTPYTRLKVYNETRNIFLQKRPHSLFHTFEFL